MPYTYIKQEEMASDPINDCRTLTIYLHGSSHDPSLQLRRRRPGPFLLLRRHCDSGALKG